MKQYVLILYGAKNSNPEGLFFLKENIGSRFKLSDRAVDALFMNLPVTLKRGLDEQQAAAYKKFFDGIGAIVEIKEEPSSKPTSETSEEKSSPSLILEEKILETPVSPPTSPPPSTPPSKHSPSATADLSSSLEFEISSPPPPPKEETQQPSHQKETSIPETLKGLHLSTSEQPEAPVREPVREATIEPTVEKPPPFPKQTLQEEPKKIPPSPPTPILPPQSTTAVEEPLEDSQTTVSEAVPTRRISPKKFMIFSGIVLISLFMMIRSFFHTPEPPSPMLDKEVIQGLLHEQKAILTPKNKKQKPEEPILHWNGEQESSTIISRLDLTTQGEKILLVKLHAHGTPPPPLTPEEIVAGKKRTPWLGRYDIEFQKEDLEAIASVKSDSGVTVKKNDKIYLEDDHGHGRTVGVADIKFTWNKSEERFDASWKLYDTAQQEAPEGESFSERVEGDKFRFFFEGKLPLIKGEKKESAKPNTPVRPEPMPEPAVKSEIP